MTIREILQTRSEGSCELCAASEGLSVYEVQPQNEATADTCLLVCETCRTQIDDPQLMDVHHWRCLNESMWSQVPAVQVTAWRMLNRLEAEDWARSLLDMLYLDDETLAWAKATDDRSGDDGASITHKDSNGVTLAAGDTVVLIKDLNVKGAGFTAKRGTAVRNISLVHDNAAHIEGRVNNQQIVILTEFVKKSG
ncbi:MAG: PhnA domain-containing protein [Rhizobiaceae bacterium]|nr:PhnA domain-containing protein [Rhizobiaceae bacterium]|tara:strand:+ start:56381 stop:56965 length:585 start_codon:yes stop_codon:yes gene_type:complete